MGKILAGLLLLCIAACSTLHPSGTVLLVGASSGTGLEIAKVLAARGDDVTAFVRKTSNRSGLAPLDVRYVVGDATNFADVKPAFIHRKVRAVVSTLGGRPGEPRPDFVGTQNFVEAAKAAGVKRMILITVIGTGDSEGTLPVRVRENLAKVIPLKNASEAYLSSSGLAYTIIRPGGLTNAAGDGKSFLTLDHSMMSSISRAELARLTVSALDDDRTIDRIYHAIDPTHASPK